MLVFILYLLSFPNKTFVKALALADHSWVKALERPKTQLAEPLSKEIWLVEQGNLARA